MKETFLPEEAPVSDVDFRRRVGTNNRTKGAWAEAIVIADLLDKGYIASVPTLPVVYDLIADRDGELLRVQVKLGSTGATMSAALGWTKVEYDHIRGVYRPTVTTKYKAADFEYLAVVDRKTREVLYVPAADIDFTKAQMYFSKERRAKYIEF